MTAFAQGLRRDRRGWRDRIDGRGGNDRVCVRRLGIEFVLDLAPASRKPTLVTARAQKHGAIRPDDVSVVAASSV